MRKKVEGRVEQRIFRVLYDKGREGLGVNQITKAVNGQPNLVISTLKEYTDKGYLVESKDPNHSQKKLYHLNPEPSNINSMLESLKKDEQVQNNYFEIRKFRGKKLTKRQKDYLIQYGVSRMTALTESITMLDLLSTSPEYGLRIRELSEKRMISKRKSRESLNIELRKIDPELSNMITYMMMQSALNRDFYWFT